jgi:hypothetical protein
MWREEGRDENDDVAMSERPTPISRRLCASFRGPQSTFNSSLLQRSTYLSWASQCVSNSVELIRCAVSAYVCAVVKSQFSDSPSH